MYMSKSQQQYYLNQFSNAPTIDNVISLLSCMRNCPITNLHKPFKNYQQLVSSVLRVCNIKVVTKNMQIEIDRFYQVQSAQFKAQYPL